MAESYVPYTLVTPAGTLNFNPAGGADGLYLYQDGVQGLDSPDFRLVIDSSPQIDGAIVYDGYSGGRYPILSGYIRANAGLTARLASEDAMRACVLSLTRADGTLSWTPTGSTARRLTVRLFQPLSIASDQAVLKTFAISLVASDPTIYGSTVTSTDTGSLGANTGGWNLVNWHFPFSFGSFVTGTATIVNAGNAQSYPVCRIYGQCTAPKVTNLTTGQYVSFPSLTIPTGSYVEVNMLTQTVKLNGVTDYTRYLDVVNSSFWSLAAGSNSIRLQAASTDANAKVTTIWSNGYA